MFLNIEELACPAKLVYQLSQELMANPTRVTQAQTLTLDVSRPNLGLSGEHGLYGSDEWWANIKAGVITLRYTSGIVQRMYHAGMELDEQGSMDFDYIGDDGILRSSSCYVNDASDIGLYQIGKKVWFALAFDKLKKQPARDGGVSFSKITLEVAVST
jgi:hypothetical protein